MSLLVTKPYDPWDPVPWVREVVQMGQRMREAKERQAAQERMHADQMQQQALQDQRRAFEFDRRLEFDRARTAADDNRADRTLALAESGELPFVVPGAGGPPSASVPALPTNDTPSGTPSGGTPDGLAPLPTVDEPTGENATGETETPEDLKARQEAWADLLPHRAGDPPNVRRSKTTGQKVTLMPGEVPPNEGTSAPAATVPKLSVPTTSPEGGVIPGLDAAAAPPAGVIPGLDGDVNSVPGMPGAPSIPMPSPDPAPPSAKVPRLPAPGAPSDGGAALMPQTIPTNPKQGQPGALTPAQQIAEITRSLSGTGLTRKQAAGVIQHAAAEIVSKQVTAPARPERPIVENFADGTTNQWDPATRTWKKLAQKPTAGAESLQDVIGDATYNKAHGTYVRPDGSEFFPNKGANGRWTIRAFRPDQKAAKLLWGSDGQVYPHDAHGQALVPVPEGVTLRDRATMQIAKTPAGGTMIVEPDGTLKPLIPEGIKMDAKSQDKYVEAAKALREAQVELNTQSKLLEDNPGTTGWFGGGTKEAVAKAKAKFDAATAEVEGIRKMFPQLNPTGAAGGAVQKVTTKAQFDALPSGAEYMNAEGKRFRKP